MWVIIHIVEDMIDYEVAVIQITTCYFNLMEKVIK